MRYKNILKFAVSGLLALSLTAGITSCGKSEKGLPKLSIGTDGIKNSFTLSYAQMNAQHVLILTPNNNILSNLKGENGFARVLTHEIMHLMQLGCICEDIEHCERRAGISIYWDNFAANTADWVWFVAGSAERNMCTLTGEEAITYQYKMDYICSMTLSNQSIGGKQHIFRKLSHNPRRAF